MMTEPPQKDTNPIYEKVETFVKQFHEKDVALKPEAKTLIIERTMGKDFLGRTIKKDYSLADIIGEQIVQYIKIQWMKQWLFIQNQKTSLLPFSLIPSLRLWI